MNLCIKTVTNPGGREGGLVPTKTQYLLMANTLFSHRTI